MNQIHSSSERRRDPRIIGNIPVKVCSDDCDIVTETKNLSRSGAYCRINKYLEPMTKLKIHLLLPFKRNEKVLTKKVSCQGVIVRTESVPREEGYNIAIFFNDILNKDADCISEFVNSTVEL